MQIYEARHRLHILHKINSKLVKDANIKCLGKHSTNKARKFCWEKVNTVYYMRVLTYTDNSDVIY